jgi:hypothetical protein
MIQDLLEMPLPRRGAVEKREVIKGGRSYLITYGVHTMSAGERSFI